MGIICTIIRRLFYTAAVVSSLLLVTTLILWPVSHYRRVAASYVTASDPEYWLAADGGRALGGYDSGGSGIAPGWHTLVQRPIWSDWRYSTWNTPEPMPFTRGRIFLGVSRVQNGPRTIPDYDILLIPFSYLAVLFSILPLLAFRSIRRRRRAGRVGLCSKCGYDLRVQREGAGGARCPECGTAVAGSGERPSETRP